MFERLRAAISAWLDVATAPEPPDRAGRLRAAVIRARMSVSAMRDGLRAVERELAAERKRLEDAERRGRLAAGIGDQETVAVAGRFAAKHRERVAVLERKLAAQAAELALAERESAELEDELRRARLDRPVREAAGHADAAWRAVERAGGARPDADPEGLALRAELDRRAREREADEQLQTLKKRMGRE